MSERPPDGQEPAPQVQGSLIATVLRGAGLASGGYVIAQVANLGVYVALARLLEPAEFGRFAAATVLTGFVLLVTDSGMRSAVIQRRDRVEEAASTAAVASVFSGLLLTAFYLAMAPLVGLLFDSSEVTAIAAVMSGTIFLRTITAAPDALMQRQFSFLRRLVIEPVQVVVFGAGAIIAAAHGLGAWSLVIGQYAGFGVSAILSWVLARWRPRLALASWSMWRELVAYGRHIFIATFILRTGEQADTVIVGRFLGEGPLGQFRYAYRIASTPFQLLLAAAAYVLFPAFARIAHDPPRLAAAFRRSFRLMIALAVPAGLVLVPLGVPLAVLIFGDVWRPAGLAAMGMCLYTGSGAVTSVASELFKAHGDPSPLTRMHAVTTVVTVASMAALLPLGLTWVAAGLSIGGVAGAAYAMLAVDRIIGIRFSSMWRSVWPATCAALLMVAVVLPLDRLVLDPAERALPAGLALMGLEAATATAVYLGVLRLLAPATVTELIWLVRSRLGRAS